MNQGPNHQCCHNGELPHKHPDVNCLKYVQMTDLNIWDNMCLKTTTDKKGTEIPWISFFNILLSSNNEQTTSYKHSVLHPVHQDELVWLHHLEIGHLRQWGLNWIADCNHGQQQQNLQCNLKLIHSQHTVYHLYIHKVKEIIKATLLSFLDKHNKLRMQWTQNLIANAHMNTENNPWTHENENSWDVYLKE